jgi:MFS family permease
MKNKLEKLLTSIASKVSVSAVLSWEFSSRCSNNVSPIAFLLTVVTGVNFIFYYGTTFFKISGFSNAFLAAMITTIVNVVSTLPGLYMVERLGRRKLLLFGAVVMTISQFIVGIVGATAAKERENSPKAALNAIIAFVCIFIFGFACSWGPVAWVLTGELFTLKTRAKQMSMATASNWYPPTPLLVNFSNRQGSGIGFLRL